MNEESMNAGKADDQAMPELFQLRSCFPVFLIKNGEPTKLMRKARMQEKQTTKPCQNPPAPFLISCLPH
jgi:hypothetical protein